MIPLVFFAVDGAIRFDAHSRNNPLEASFTSLAVSQSVGLESVAERIVLLVCGLLFCMKMPQLLEVAKGNKFLVALPIFALTSVAWSQFPRESLQYGVYACVDVAFALYIVARFDSDRRIQLFIIVGWIVVLASACAALVFPQYGIDNQGGEGTVNAWIGIFPHKNWCSIMIVFLLSAGFYIRHSSPLARVARFVFIAFSLLIVALTKSRTGWFVAACLLLYVAATALLKRFKTMDRLFVGLFAGGVVAALGAIVTLNFSALMLLVGKDPTLTGRTVLWSLAFDEALKRPFMGYGYRAFWAGLRGESANVSLSAGWIVPAAHDGFLDLWLGLGVVGVFLVVCSMSRAVRDGYTCFRAGASPAAEWYLCIVFLTVVANIAELTLMVPRHLAWIMYVIACAGLSQEARGVRARMRVARTDYMTRPLTDHVCAGAVATTAVCMAGREAGATQ
jgi:exopolysaccharide production protein ExoQ